MERLRKGGLDVRMALVAESRLTLFEHGRLRFELVTAVATVAADESFAMSGPLEVRMVANVASQALLGHLLRCCL